MSARTEPSFTKETELCAAFIDEVRKEGKWEVYPETGGFDILLVRKVDGFQIGIEAKLTLNAKVVVQVAERDRYSYVTASGPDCRAVLIPEDARADLGGICTLLGITVIRMGGPGVFSRRGDYFWPRLPRIDERWSTEAWFERAPARRIELPEWVPDVIAGDKSPLALTDWKIRAIKIAILLEARGFVTRQDFKFFEISMSRWIDPGQGWLTSNGTGGWTAGPHMPNFRAQHPVNFEQIKADAAKWMPKALPAIQGALSI